MTKKKLIVIAGPTASGKTDIAIEVAQHFKTAIINADSRQCYKELNIGVAKPSIKQLRNTKHYFVNSHSIHENINAGQFEKLALSYLDEIFRNNNTAVLAGGTGLYIKALCDGIDIMPEVSIDIKTQVNDTYNIKGINWLQEEIKKYDPHYYEKGEIQNPARLLRALSFVLSTGESILHFQNNSKTTRDFDMYKYCIDTDRATLYKNINTRVDRMIEEGLAEEVKDLIPYKHLKNLQTVGYTEFFNYYNQETDLDTAIHLIKQNTRHYAKRQITWFKKQGFTWASAPQLIQQITQL